MKKFLKYFLALSILVFSLVFAIGHITISDEFIIEKTYNTPYHKVAWNLNLFAERSQELEGTNLFFGPSLTEGGICDSTLQAQGVRALNLGVNNTGYEIANYFIERSLEFKPKAIYNFHAKYRQAGLHFMTPLLYTPSHLIASGQSFSNTLFAEFLFKRCGYVLNYLFWEIGTDNNEERHFSKYGSIYQDGVYRAQYFKKAIQTDIEKDFETLNIWRNNFKYSFENNESWKTKVKILRRKLIHELLNNRFFTNVKSQNSFIECAAKTVQTRGIPYMETYIPTLIDSRYPGEFNSEFYGGKSARNLKSLKNFNFLFERKFWADQGHLSKEGSIAFSKEMVRSRQFELD